MTATNHTSTADDQQDTALEATEATILQILPKQVSENGNGYTALVTATNPWIFVWNSAWRREIEQHRGHYFYLDARLYVSDHRAPEDYDPFYWLEGVVPQTRHVADQYLHRWKQRGRTHLVQDVARCIAQA